jgi:uncharacterized protein involved in exopolysaccharide biosynthesis
MNNHQKNNNENEIDIKELLQLLWNGKVYIFFFSLLFMMFASLYLQGAERKHLIEYKLKPVADTQQNNAISSFGSFASIAGIQLPSSSSSDFNIFKELLTSVEVSEIVIINKNLIKNIFNREWDLSINNFSEIPKSKLKSNFNLLKRTITGDNEVNYMPPNARRLSTYIVKNISIDEDKKTGFLTIRSVSSRPEVMSLLISEVIKIADEIMRQRYINFSREPLAFYKEKLRTARSREHREALAELISTEEQKLMLASKGVYFTAEPYIEPVISLHPVAPKSALVLLLSLIFGLFTGCGVVLLHSAIIRNKR